MPGPVLSRLAFLFAVEADTHTVWTVIGFLGDFLRFWWALLYWNVRKTVFRLRRGRGAPPCQNPSDSGRALETGCDACQQWHKGAHFSRVCPLLVVTPAGLRCSVDATEVRPFWGRACAYFGGTVITLWLIGTLSAFILLRTIGYPVSLTTIAWPPAWQHFKEARASLYSKKAAVALKANRLSEALIDLNIAYANNPTDFNIGFQYAYLLQIARPDMADQIFDRLMKEHPERRVATAEVWFKSLITHGHFDKLEHLAGDMLREDPERRTIWLHALFTATRFTGNKELLSYVIARRPALPAVVAACIQTEADIRSGLIAESLPGLSRAIGDSSLPYLPYYQVSRLLSLGKTTEALGLLQVYSTRIGPREQVQLQMEAFAVLQRNDLVLAEIDRMISGSASPAEIEIICTHLIRHPNREAFDHLFAKITPTTLPETTESYPLYLTLYCTAGAIGDNARLTEIGLILKKISGANFVALSTVEAFFRGELPVKHIETFLPALQPIPLEISYALYERYPPRVAAKPVQRP